jgi:hypothetical protein
VEQRSGDVGLADHPRARQAFLAALRATTNLAGHGILI